MTYRQTETSSATRWSMWLPVSLPKMFSEGERPKAIMLNEAGTVTLIGSDGVQVVFTPAVGIPIQLRPHQLVSATVPVICLFD